MVTRPRSLVLALALGVSLAVASLIAQSSPAPATSATWRLDFFHTGGQGLEVFSVDRVIVEPLPWPGAPSGNLDPSGFGSYRFEVRTPAGAVIYSRGYSPIFAEWVTTAEAPAMHRTFHESLRFPEPRAPVDVVVFKRDAANRFEEVWRTRVDPADMFIDRATPPKRTAIAVEHHGDPTAKVDVLFIGDGYTAGECEQKFRGDTRRMADALFTQEPFRSRRTDFNVWGLCPPSPESGISRPSTGVHVASPVGATYDAFGSERYVLTMENKALREIASWAPYEFVTILANNDTYGGGGMYNVFSTAAVDNEWADYLFVHEFAHHFGALADEYYTSPVAYQPPTVIVEPWEPNVTALADPSSLKWRDLVRPGTPVPTPWPKERFEAFSRDLQARRAKIRADRRPESEMSALFREELEFDTRLFATAEHQAHVGAFQGANYDAAAYYRPAIDCIMFTRDHVPFCPVCRRALGGVIDLYTPKP